MVLLREDECLSSSWLTAVVSLSKLAGEVFMVLLLFLTFLNTLRPFMLDYTKWQKSEDFIGVTSKWSGSRFIIKMQFVCTKTIYPLLK